MRADSAVVDELRESPNTRARKADEELRFVVVHGTWMADDGEALARLCDPKAEVSCHYYIDRRGRVTQLVPEARVAWHAGASRAELDGRAVEGLNGWSIGIEIGNAGPFAGTPDKDREAAVDDAMWQKAETYREAQYAALIELLRDILTRNPGISPARVLGHDEVSPGRKSDPGRHFDWARLRAAGVRA